MEIYVISGGPGTGKTSVINELAKEFKILKEAARELGDKDSRFKGKSVKEIRMKEFQDAIFEFQKKQIENLKENEIVFSDRGLGDTIAYYKFYKIQVPEKIINYSKKFRYSRVFILEPLDFYEKDELRKEEKEEQLEIQNLVVESYRELGYEIIKVPLMSVEERVRFIKRKIDIRK